MESKELKQYKKGNFNQASFERQSDSSIIVTMHRRGEKKLTKFRVRNLYQPDEEELDVNTGAPKH